MNKETQKKLQDVVALVDKVLVDPDIELDYEIPDVSVTGENADVSGDPYIVVKYVVNGTHKQNQKIPIKKIYMKKTPEDIANLVTFYIEQFMEQVESVESGAQ